MTTPTDPSDHDVVRFLVTHGRPEGEPRAGACPEDEALARYAEGRARPEEREALERHLASCRACQATAATLAAALEPRALARGPWWRLRPRAAAAALFLAVGVLGAGAWLALRRSGSLEPVLLASARELADARPDLFEGFRPLDHAERMAPVHRTERGAWDPRPLHPDGAIVETTPEFRWEPRVAATDARVNLLHRGAPVWTTRVPPQAGPGVVRFPYPSGEPPLAPGRAYEWEIVASGPLGSVQGARSFQVLSPEDHARFQEAVREIEARAPREARALLRAHLALRRELFGEAEASARAAFREHPADPVVRETLLRALRLRSDPDAETLDPAAPAGR